MGVSEGARNEMVEKSQEPFSKEKAIGYWGAEDCVLRYARRSPLITLALMTRFANVSNERTELSLQHSAYGRNGGKLFCFGPGNIKE